MYKKVKKIIKCFKMFDRYFYYKYKYDAENYISTVEKIGDNPHLRKDFLKFSKVVDYFNKNKISGNPVKCLMYSFHVLDVKDVGTLCPYPILKLDSSYNKLEIYEADVYVDVFMTKSVIIVDNKTKSKMIIDISKYDFFINELKKYIIDELNCVDKELKRMRQLAFCVLEKERDKEKGLNHHDIMNVIVGIDKLLNIKSKMK